MDVYEQLREILDTHPSGAPKTGAFDKILRILFTPEEAALACNMSFKPKNIDSIAEASSVPADKTKKMLEAMADKVIVFSRNKDGEMLYGLLPTIPGLFEFPFMKGGGTPMHDELGKLWEQYHHEAMGESFCGNPTPLVRIVPVKESLRSVTAIHPYEEVTHFISDADFIALTECACRVSVKKCDAPKDVCMIFGPTAEFLVQRGYARQATKEEAMMVLDRAEEAGLVHTSNNSTDRANLICNCCPCCCTILRGMTELMHPHAFSTSRFTARVDGDRCTGCRTCIDDRCPVGAIAMPDNVALAGDRCIGCGLCVTACPSEAITLMEREKTPEIPGSMKEMGIKVVQEKGKLDKFIKIMQR